MVSHRPDGDLEAAVSELASVAEAFASVPDLQRVLVVPTVPPETKTAILDAVLSELGVSDVIRRFVHVVQQHYRTAHLTDIESAFRDAVDRAVRLFAEQAEAQHVELLPGSSEGFAESVHEAGEASF